MGDDLKAWGFTLAHISILAGVVWMLNAALGWDLGLIEVVAVVTLQKTYRDNLRRKQETPYHD